MVKTLLLCSLLALTGCSGDSSDNTECTSDNADIIVMTEQELIDNSDIIVVGKNLELTKTEIINGLGYSFYKIEVNQKIKGESFNQITIRLLGIRLSQNGVCQSSSLDEFIEVGQIYKMHLKALNDYYITTNPTQSIMR